MSFEVISVIGLGYIGLPTAAMFAAYGKNVIGVDVNQSAIDTINRGEIHIVEPDLDGMVLRAVSDGLLKAVNSPLPADAFLIAVPTPFDNDSHEPDLSYIKKSVEAIAPVLKKGDLVVLESTSPVGTTEQIAKWLSAIRSDLKFPSGNNKEEATDVYLAHCPERVLPGRVVTELVENARIIGGMTNECSRKAVELYKTFVRGECIVTNARTAEMAKLTENASRDVSIAFANELSLICDELSIDVWELIALANRHPRVNILQPGPGVGGHCIAVDPWFIVNKTPDLARLMKTAREVNDSKPLWVVDKVKAEIALRYNAPEAAEVKIACFGIAFKANIDDLRESPALDITQKLSDYYPGQIFIVEPNINQLPGSFMDKAELVDMSTAIAQCDVVVLLVDHSQFTELDVEVLEAKLVVDTKGIWR